MLVAFSNPDLLIEPLMKERRYFKMENAILHDFEISFKYALFTLLHRDFNEVFMFFTGRQAVKVMEAPEDQHSMSEYGGRQNKYTSTVF